MRWSSNDAASPLVVLATFVGIAVAITALGVFFIVDNNQVDIQFVEQDAAGATILVVDSVRGGLRWDDLTFELVDPAGNDVASAYLEIPVGLVESGDILRFTSEPPSGLYFLDVEEEGNDVAVLALQF